MSILDAHGNPVEVEPILDAPSRDSYDERMASAPMAVHTLGGGHIEDDDEPCGCDESKALRVELTEAQAWILAIKVSEEEEEWTEQQRREAEVVKAERDYLIQFCDASEVMQMRKHLAAEWAERQG